MSSVVRRVALSGGAQNVKAARRRQYIKHALLGAGVVGCGAFGFSYWYYEGGPVRTLRAFFAGVRVVAAYKLCGPNVEDLERAHDRVAKLILDTCMANGGLYVKFGQVISSMNHVLPAAYTATLSRLHDQAPCIPYSKVQEVIRETFGKDIDDIYLAFETVPLGSASIAQVHRAMLPDGRVVAVKVIKPAVRRQLEWDLLAYRTLARMLEFVFKIPICWSVPFTEQQLRKEVDFVIEGKNADMCREAFKDREDIHVPEVHWEYTGRSILTCEWIDGFKFGPDSVARLGLDAKPVTKSLCEAFADMIFIHGLVHADPHPGNIFVRPHPKYGKPYPFPRLTLPATGPRAATRNPPMVKSPSALENLKSGLRFRRLKKNKVKPSNFRKFWNKMLGRPLHQVVLLDHGLYVHESPQFRDQYCRLWKAIMSADIPGLERVCREWGVNDPDLFVSFNMMRPYDRSTAPDKPTNYTREQAAQFQLEAKERAVRLLQDTENLPRELAFVMRAMNLVRYDNKEMGAPVNRIRIFADAAARGTGPRTPWFWAKHRVQLWTLSAYMQMVSWYYWLTRQRALNSEELQDEAERQVAESFTGGGPARKS